MHITPREIIRQSPSLFTFVVVRDTWTSQGVPYFVGLKTPLAPNVQLYLRETQSEEYVILRVVRSTHTGKVLYQVLKWANKKLLDEYWQLD